MNIQEIKQRTKSIKNTLQITKAMELIASIKMRKAIEVAQTSREYSDRARALLSRLAAEGKSYKHPLLASPNSKKSLLIIASSDKGLCGSHNTEIFRASYKAIEEKKKGNQEVDLIVIGNKARNHFRRIKELKIIADFETFGDSIEYLEASPIAQLIIEEFSKGEYSEVNIVFRQFESMIRQNAQVIKILPLSAIRETQVGANGRSPVHRYEFEPEPEKVLDSVLPQLVKVMVYQTLLENNASEHAARMVAMKNASDAAGEIIQDLEFTFNRLRQERITSEISEIASGAEALS
ncbi:MAG: ATP synthase gamma chain [Berkelbacteria bacterium GW2011_GWA2_38_9]|uniref:ATP synthase gamma chain n=1 Tax=Berkelbacteria bacterium GW2011_GWA2_38_9 TaxID=1618334 RepID=A0A0G0LED6_9BACT|nr:MAG: ATP synthase gamma chain [Berkelbacteria bacterium GW2011_GWA2_38_9]